MRNPLIHLLLISLLLGACAQQPAQPVAIMDPHLLVSHGDSRVDPFYWMNARDSKQVLEYINAENEYTDAMMRDTRAMQRKLIREMRGRIKESDLTVPVFENGYHYYTRYDNGLEFPLYCRRKGSMEAKEEVYLNVNELASGYDYFSAVGVNVSPNNRMLAFGVDTIGRRHYTLYFKDIETGQVVRSGMVNTTGGIAWANDSETYFYVMRDKSLRPWQVFRHSISDPNGYGEPIYKETDPAYSTFVYTDRSKAFIFIGSESTLSSEYHFIDADNPFSKPTVVQPRMHGVDYFVSYYKDYFYITTNLDAKNFRLVCATVQNSGKEFWKEIIPHRDDVLMMRADVYSNYLVVSERTQGITQIRVINWHTQQEHYLDFGEEVYSTWLRYNPEFTTDIIQYTYSSFTTPMSVYEYNMSTKERNLIKQTEVLGGFNPNDYETTRVWAHASDGERVPISMVYRKGLELNGDNPTLLYAYGAYGYSFEPYFEHERLSLIDRGFIFAIAHVRGGQELGRQWYEDGRLMSKMNTFTDFIACSEFLIEQGYTNPNKLFAMGASAGGLVMGAIANMRPDLYKGIIAEVPFVDVITTMLDTTIPLTTSEYDEWGDPNIPEHYHYILAYSPYDRVREQEYPNMLITGAYHDSQVQYFEPTKWIARLREKRTDSNLLLLRVDMETGHSGTTGRFKALEETAFIYSFIFKVMGIGV